MNYISNKENCWNKDRDKEGFYFLLKYNEIGGKSIRKSAEFLLTDYAVPEQRSAHFQTTDPQLAEQCDSEYPLLQGIGRLL